MSPLKQLEDYREMRDAARRLLRADIDMVREDIAQRGLAARAVDRVTDATLDLLDDALDMADDHRGAVAAGIGAVATAGALWLARRPIIDVLVEVLSFNEEQDEQADDAGEPATATERWQDK